MNAGKEALNICRDIAASAQPLSVVTSRVRQIQARYRAYVFYAFVAGLHVGVIMAIVADSGG